MVEKEPVYGQSKRIYCPTCGRETVHKWIGYYHHYSEWECEACGRVVLAEPYKTL